MEFNDLLASKRIDPSQVLVLRHRPWESELRRILPWLATEKPDIFNFYQQTQSTRVENQMQRASVVAAFIGHEAAKAVFVGLYEMRGWRSIKRAVLQKNAAQRELIAHGMGCGGRRVQLLFDWFPFGPIRTGKAS